VTDAFNPRRAVLIAAVGLSAITVLVYAPVLNCYFVDDDFQWIAGALWFNPSILYRIDRVGHFYRPVTQLYFWLAASVLGPSPFAFHAVSLALHAANGVLVFLLGKRIGDVKLGALASLFFAVQPRSFEAIGWIAGVAHLLCAGAYLSTMILHARAPDGPGRLRVLSLATFVTALLTNETGVTLLPMLAVWDVCFNRDFAARTALRRYLPFVLILVAYLGVEAVVTSRNYVVTEGHYRVGRHVVPNVLHYISWMWVGRRGVWSLAAIAALWLVLIVLGSRPARFAALWIVITLAPVSLFTWGLSARYTYLPAVGLSLLLGLLFTSLLRRADVSRIRPLAYGTLAILAVAVVIRSGVYARRGVEDLCERGRVYKRYADLVRDSHVDIPYMKTVKVPRRPAGIPERFVQPLIEVESLTRVSGVEEAAP